MCLSTLFHNVFKNMLSNLLHTSSLFSLCAWNFSWSTDHKMGLKSLSGLTFPLKAPLHAGYIPLCMCL